MTKLNRIQKNNLKSERAIVWLLLNHQLSESIAQDLKDRGVTHVWAVESLADSQRLPFHWKKILLNFVAQRRFLRRLVELGFDVKLLEADSTESSVVCIAREWKKNGVDFFKQAYFVDVDDFHTRQEIQESWSSIPIEVISSDVFFLAKKDEWISKIKKNYRMEFFYREMRKKMKVLIDKDEKPVGGEWNFDKENRRRLPQEVSLPIESTFPIRDPAVLDDVRQVIKKLKQGGFSSHFGAGLSKVDENSFRLGTDIGVPTSREEAMQLLKEFTHHKLESFGPYEDALTQRSNTVFHSLLSIPMNLNLISAYEILEEVLRYSGFPMGAWAKKLKSDILPSVEGFVRQILGWREYMRIAHVALMPSLISSNALKNSNPLPDFFWSGETDFSCLRETIRSVRETGYSHHISRLMVLSNWANLLEVDPKELWYWFSYAYLDAWEWVVTPNVLGMSTFADGGVIASKPYVSSAAYIDKMSDYCEGCKYSPKANTLKPQCPMNNLYWNFMIRNEKGLMKNPRMSMLLNHVRKKTEEDKAHLQSEAKKIQRKIFAERSQYGRLSDYWKTDS